MDADYPAAHSMDTCFYAVDRDGHVAVFSTGEAGALPMAAAADDEGQMRDHLAQLPRGEAAHDLRGRLCPRRPFQAREHLAAEPRNDDYPVLVFLPTLDAVREEIEAGRAVPVAATTGAAVLFTHPSGDVFRRLHEDGACLGCFYFFEEENEDWPDLATRGLFRYEHLTENWISGPYGLQRSPLRPIHVDQLPPEVRRQVKGVRFQTLCFADTPYIQPVEHGECVSWESAYLDVTGSKVRPIPGKEAEYRAAYADLASIQKSLGQSIEFEPPPDGQDSTPQQ
jgi:hypothetical protein